MGLQDLPVETIVRIFAFLDYKDLLRISRLSRFFRDVYENFPELQYSVALQISGMVDGDPSIDIRCKLGELERRERAWRTMDLTRKVTVKVPHRTSHIYDLSGGVYLLGDCKNSIISRDTHTLRFFDLTTCASGPVIRHDPWPEMRVDSNIVDIGFGLNEFDLVAVVGIKSGHDGEPGSIVLSLRELSTGAPHPLARIPDVIVDPVSNYQGKLSIMLEIVGPRLLLLLTWHRGLQRIQDQDQDKLLLFNWWDGTKVMTETAPQGTWNGFVFLSPELVLLPDKDRGLEIIRLPDVTKGFSSKGFERVLRLALPSLQDRVQMGAIQCRAEPNPFGATPHPSMLEAKTEAEAAFVQRMRERKRPLVSPDPMKAVVLLQMYYREFNNANEHDLFMGHWGVLRHNVSLIMHREFLLHVVGMFANKPPLPLESSGSASEVDMDVEPSVTTVPWAQWGPDARWMADDTHVSNWITTTAGQRYVGTDEEGHIVVKDFNPIAVRRARAATAMRMDTDTDADAESDKLSQWELDGSRSRTGYRFVSIFDSESDSEPDQETHLDEHERMEAEDNENASVSQGTDRTSLSPEREDPTWKAVRVIEGYNEIEDIELRQLFGEECKWPLPCVEYTSRRRYDHHGLLMDEERIIGLRHDEHTGAIVEFDVFTL